MAPCISCKASALHSTKKNHHICTSRGVVTRVKMGLKHIKKDTSRSGSALPPNDTHFASSGTLPKATANTLLLCKQLVSQYAIL